MKHSTFFPLYFSQKNVGTSYVDFCRFTLHAQSTTHLYSNGSHGFYSTKNSSDQMRFDHNGEKALWLHRVYTWRVLIYISSKMLARIARTTACDNWTLVPVKLSHSNIVIQFKDLSMNIFLQYTYNMYVRNY